MLYLEDYLESKYFQRFELLVLFEWALSYLGLKTPYQFLDMVLNDRLKLKWECYAMN